MWTEFNDNHSGGNIKIPPYGSIWIELPEELAVLFFVEHFDRSPYYVSCSCCGEDYSIYTHKRLKVSDNDVDFCGNKNLVIRFNDLEMQKFLKGE